MAQLSRNIDVIVIGAGIFGIAAARTYLDVHPESELLVLDRDTSPGGVWSASRSYSSFMSQTGLGLAEFSDARLQLPEGEPTWNNLFHARNFTNYVEEYIDTHVYSGKSMRDRIMFGFSVTKIEKVDDYWTIEGAHISSEEKAVARTGDHASTRDNTTTFRCSKLIVATGTSDIPNIPDLNGQEDFRGKIIHQKYFGQSNVLTNPSVKNITIYGGGKSAADMVYASVKAGKSVSWVIRASGEGPATFTSGEGKAGYANATELAATRVLSSLSPSCFQPQNWWTRFLYTSYGRVLVDKMWAIANEMSHSVARYRDRPGAKPGFQNLESATDTFWCNGHLGLIQWSDFWDVMSTGPQIYRSDVTSLDSDSLHLADGSVIPTDVLLLGTGWKMAQNDFFSASEVLRLGLPHKIPRPGSSKEESMWSELEQAADLKILSLFPILANPPKKSPTSNITEIRDKRTPYRLHNCITPIADNSVAFVGQVLVANMFRAAEVQGLWAVASLDGNTPSGRGDVSLDGQKEEIAYVNAFAKRRYPTQGHLGMTFFFDTVGYTDKLLSDLGLNSHLRKGWWGRWFGVCDASDLKGVVEEYKMKYRK